MDRIDLTGCKFGKLTVERFSHTSKNRHSMWICICECGTKKVMDSHNLKSGCSKSCGSCRETNFIGIKFGEWTVISEAKKRGYSYRWLCRCSCGTTREVLEKSLKSGKSNSCGCKRTQSIIGDSFGELVVIDEKRQNGKIVCTCKCSCGIIKDIDKNGLTYGRVISCGHIRRDNFYKVIRKHGLSKTRIINIYSLMVKRCIDPISKSYSRYGGRGITVCKDWAGENGFINFYEWSQHSGYEKNLTLDRIDNNGDYEPLNCRWATMKEQMNNMSKNHHISHNGQTMTISEWADHLGVKYGRLAYLLRYYNFNMDTAISKLKIDIQSDPI